MSLGAGPLVHTNHTCPLLLVTLSTYVQSSAAPTSDSSVVTSFPLLVNISAYMPLARNMSGTREAKVWGVHLAAFDIIKYLKIFQMRAAQLKVNYRSYAKYLLRNT